MRELVLLRHAAAEERAANDFGRKLTPKGRVDASAAGRRLAAQGWVPDVVLSSPAPRAYETATLACASIGFPTPAIVQVPAIYDADPSALLGILAALPPAARRVLLVGHNPGLSEVAASLVDDDRLDAVGIAKAGSVWCELPDDWSTLGEGAALRHALAG